MNKKEKEQELVKLQAERQQLIDLLGHAIEGPWMHSTLTQDLRKALAILNVELEPTVWGFKPKESQHK